MKIRISALQKEFLQMIQDCGMFSETVENPLYWGHLLDSFIYNFRESESAMRTWIQNLASRNLIVIEKDYFYKLTDEGKSALSQQPN